MAGGLVLFLAVATLAIVVLAAPSKHRLTQTDWPSDYEDRDTMTWQEKLQAARTPPDDWDTYDYNVNMDWAREVDKRSPACIRKCVEQGALHPIQCHSLC